MIKVGTVKSVWRYPVKGMAGESLASAELSEMGVSGDRVLAVQDEARQEIQSCKFRPELLRCRAAFTDTPIEVEAQTDVSASVDVIFPDGDRLNAASPDIHQKISDLLGHRSRLQSLRPASDDVFYQRFKEDDQTWLNELKATFEREPGEPLPDLDNLPEDMQTYVSLLGSFFLVSPCHILTTASVDYLRHKAPSCDWNIERFRPNLVIETLPGMEGLVEQAWIGKRLNIGGVSVYCENTAPRCGAVIREQQNITSEPEVLRTIVREATQNLGIYGNINCTGAIKVGDVVYLNNEP
jgi:uncharacterized protein YcbX